MGKSARSNTRTAIPILQIGKSDSRPHERRAGSTRGIRPRPVCNIEHRQSLIQRYSSDPFLCDARFTGSTTMDHPRAVFDDTLVRLETLKAHLTERIGESQDVRARLLEALKANAWPDVRNASQRFPADDRRRD